MQPNWPSSLGNYAGDAADGFFRAVDVARTQAESVVVVARSQAEQAAALARAQAEQAAAAARAQAEQVKSKVEQVRQRTGSQQRSSNFGVDFTPLPPSSPLPPLPPLDVRVCSWNLHGREVDNSDAVAEWLTPNGSAADIFVVGIQELVDLGPRTVVLNNSGDEIRQAAVEARLEQALDQSEGGTLKGAFVKVCSFGMVGLALLIYIRDWLAPYLLELDYDRVKTGLDGMGGNKGGVCARLQLGSLSACFVNVHLPSGQSATAERNQNLAQVLADAFQRTSTRGATRPQKKGFARCSQNTVARHNFVVVFGDFNSRLDQPKEDLWPQGPPEAWLRRDQMLLGLMPTLRGFREGVISFPPTYKYVVGTGRLSTSRIPSWCDRVVYKAEADCEVELVEYSSFPELMRTSDHHPVAALFQVGNIGGVGPGTTGGGMACSPWLDCRCRYRASNCFAYFSRRPSRSKRRGPRSTRPEEPLSPTAIRSRPLPAGRRNQVRRMLELSQDSPER